MQSGLKSSEKLDAMILAEQPYSTDNPYANPGDLHQCHDNIAKKLNLPSNSSQISNDISQATRKELAEATECCGVTKPKLWSTADPLRYPAPKPKDDNNDAWETCAKLVQSCDKEMCESWKDEINQLLLFAGLFSAAVTAFAVDSYKSLTPDTQDTAVALLSRISLQLDNLNHGNSAMQSIASIDTVFTPTTSSIRINIFWFVSLTLSLSTVLVGILCLQWIREYQKEASLKPRDKVAFRQFRYDALLWWQVPNIIYGLPLLLQLALALFFAGQIDLLWHLNTSVAYPVMVVIGLTLAILVLTTMIPTIQQIFTKERRIRGPPCPYKSSQSWVFRVIIIGALTGVLNLCVWTFNQLNSSLPFWFVNMSKSLSYVFTRSTWLKSDLFWRGARNTHYVWAGQSPDRSGPLPDHGSGLAWIAATLSQNDGIPELIYAAYLDLTCSSQDKVLQDLNLLVGTSVPKPTEVSPEPGSTFDREIRSLYLLDLLNRQIAMEPVWIPHHLELIFRICNSPRRDIETYRCASPFGYDWCYLTYDLKYQLALSFGKKFAQHDGIIDRFTLNHALTFLRSWQYDVNAEESSDSLDPDLLREIVTFNKSLQLGMLLSPGKTDLDRLEACIRYTENIVMVCYDQLHWDKLFHASPEFIDTFESLVSHINVIILGLEPSEAGGQELQYSLSIWDERVMKPCLQANWGRNKSEKETPAQVLNDDIVLPESMGVIIYEDGDPDAGFIPQEVK